MSQLILHRGARPVDRVELDQVEAPPPTDTWFPLRHSQVLSTVEETLGDAGFAITRSNFALSQDNARFFGTLDLSTSIIEGVTEHRTTADWLEAFDKADIPAMPVRTLEELFDDPHLQATGFFTEREHPSEGPIKTFASPLDFEKTKVEYRRHAPRLGGDGVEVLREAGISEAEIETLRADKTLIVPTER